MLFSVLMVMLLSHVTKTEQNFDSDHHYSFTKIGDGVLGGTYGHVIINVNFTSLHNKVLVGYDLITKLQMFIIKNGNISAETKTSLLSIQTAINHKFAKIQDNYLDLVGFFDSYGDKNIQKWPKKYQIDKIQTRHKRFAALLTGNVS